jgi:hypothetical protein
MKKKRRQIKIDSKKASIEFFLAKSYHSDGHAVYEIRREDCGGSSPQ